MKYIVVLSDGMAGRPLEELGGRTTLEAADTPVMDELAPVSETGNGIYGPGRDGAGKRYGEPVCDGI